MKQIRQLIDAVNRITSTIKRSSDPYDTIIADITTPKIYISSTNPFSSERLNYVENGTDTDFYSSSKTSQDGSKYVLNASAGDKLTIETRQRIVYSPGHELEYGIAWFLESELPDNAEVRAELINSDGDGFSSKYTKSESSYDLKRDGSILNSSTFKNEIPLTQPQIDKGRVNMYGVGAGKLNKYSLKDDYSDNFVHKARVGNLDDVNTDVFNLKMKITIDCSSATSGVTLNALSMQGKILGNASKLDRSKSGVFFNLGNSSIDSSSWTPVLAMKKRSGYEAINVELDRLDVMPTDRMKIVAVAVDPSNTDASGFDTADESTTENDAVEFTESVSSPTSPQGRQMTAILAEGGKINAGEKTSADITTPIYDDDIIVFLARTKNATGANTDLAPHTQQSW